MSNINKTNMKTTIDTTDREILISREFNAPRELVWEAMTNPKHIVNWWGPRGFTTTIEVMDVRPGGAWNHVMQGPDGTKYPNRSIFTEVLKPERIVFQHGGGRENGPDVAFVATWSFEALAANKTRVTARMVFPNAAARDFVVKEFHAIEGGKQTLARLGELLARQLGGEPFVSSRVFAAPRERVWQAWTDREHLVKWFGPKGTSMPAAKMDFRPGGIFHYCLRMPNGNEMWGKWVFREIAAPERLVLIHSFSDAQGGVTSNPFSPTWPLETLATTTFTEEAGGTKVTIEWIPLNATEAELQTFAAARQGMNQGWSGTFEQLAEYLAKG